MKAKDTNMANRILAKKALDSIISKGRIHLYKPIQIAEILYHARIEPKSINLANLEDYRNHSKRWRDEISQILVGRICTSSQKYQDHLFDVISPEILVELGKENIRTNGAVEAYIYGKITVRHVQLSTALNYIQNATPSTFNVKEFIDSFRNEPGLKRSIDKIYEIVVYSIFMTIIEALELQVTVSLGANKIELLSEFADFAKMVMCLDVSNMTQFYDAKVFRVGVTNAADRGLDMYSNWGPAIQIKHLSLDEELAEGIVNSVTSDKIIIVCKDAEELFITSLLNQLGWGHRIQSVVTESNLINWYEKALRGHYSREIGNRLLECLRDEISNEFPSVDDNPQILKKRHYETITDNFWV